MATKQFYATKPFKFANRMLTANEPVQMDGPTARLYLALNAISPTKPRGTKAAVQAMTTEDVATAPPVTPPPAPSAAQAPTRKAAPRKRTTKKRATAKK